MRIRSSTAVVLLGAALAVSCSDPDVRETRPDRTRDADGIIKLYRNRKQGDWMLKGKVIQVQAATVVEVGKGSITVTGIESLNPVPMILTFHDSEKRIGRLSPGDRITFKGICDGMDGAIRFRACVILSISAPLQPS